MKWASVLSRALKPENALAEALAALKSEIGGAQPDAAFLFVLPQHRLKYAEIAAAVLKELNPRHLLGCSGGGVIGGGHEAEDAPALSLTAALMPGVEIRPFRFEDATLPDLDGG